MTARRLAVFAVAAANAAYFGFHERLRALSLWWNVAVIAALVIPGVFATVGLLLPLYRVRLRWLVAILFVGLAVAFSILDASQQQQQRFSITAVDQATKTITVAGSHGSSFPVRSKLTVTGSANQGRYTVASATAVTSATVIVVAESLPSGVSGGTVTDSADATGVSGWESAASFAKLGAATFAGWLFLDFFEEAAWIVIVALIIPWVDAYSVWRGPTKTIVQHHQGVFERLSFAFPVPGGTDTANLGIPDLLFFALFLAASGHFRLRVGLTWLLMTASFGATVALAVWLKLGGLPALPLLSLAFLTANGDLLWRRVRAGRPSPEGA